MNKKLALIIGILLTLIPAGIVWVYWQDALQYQNSPHVTTLWDKNDPLLYLNPKDVIRQSFEVTQDGLTKITVRLESGAGQYQWSVQRSLPVDEQPSPDGSQALPSLAEPLYSGDFNGRDVQNYDFISLLLPPSLLQAGNEYWLEIVRADNSNEESKGIAIFQTANDYPDGQLLINNQPQPTDLVFQLYYK